MQLLYFLVDLVYFRVEAINIIFMFLLSSLYHELLLALVDELVAQLHDRVNLVDVLYFACKLGWCCERLYV
jgi:hypothetical protein